MNKTTSHLHGVVLAGMLALMVLPARADSRGVGAGGASDSPPFWEVACTDPTGVTEVPQDWIAKATNLGLANAMATAPTLWNTGQAPQAGGENLDQRGDALRFLSGGDKRDQAAGHTNDGVTANWQASVLEGVNDLPSDTRARRGAIWADPAGRLDHSQGILPENLGVGATSIDTIPAVLTACAIALFGVALCGAGTTRRRKR